MRFSILSIALVVACSSPAATNAGVDGAVIYDGNTQDLCEDRPCLTAITNTDDWAVVAVDFDQRCDLDQLTKYLTPANSNATLQQTVYQDVEVHRYHLDFMQQVLTEYFGGMPAETYYELVQRRATRHYFAGVIFRVRNGNSVVGYGFDVIIDPTNPAEQLS